MPSPSRRAVLLRIAAARKTGELATAVAVTADYLRVLGFVGASGDTLDARVGLAELVPEVEALIDAGADVAPVVAVLTAWAEQQPDVPRILRMAVKRYLRIRLRMQRSEARSAMHTLEHQREVEAGCQERTLPDCRRWLRELEIAWEARHIATGAALERAIDRSWLATASRASLLGWLRSHYRLALTQATVALRVAQRAGSECGELELLAPHFRFSRFGAANARVVRTDAGWQVQRPSWALGFGGASHVVLTCSPSPPIPPTR